MESHWLARSRGGGESHFAVASCRRPPHTRERELYMTLNALTALKRAPERMPSRSHGERKLSDKKIRKGKMKRRVADVEFVEIVLRKALFYINFFTVFLLYIYVLNGVTLHLN